MSVKNIIYFAYTFITSVLIALFGYNVSALNIFDKSLSSNNKFEKESRIVKVKQNAEDILCTEVIDCSPEIKMIKENGEVSYRKIVNLTREYKRKTHDPNYELISKYRSKIKFCYDKKSYVKSEMLGSDQQSAKGWLIKGLSETLPENKHCTESIKFTLYQKNLNRYYDYKFDGYTDIFFDITGNMGINSDVN